MEQGAMLHLREATLDERFVEGGEETTVNVR